MHHALPHPASAGKRSASATLPCGEGIKKVAPRPTRSSLRIWRCSTC